ncbi:glycosyltransferase family 4 protein [Frigidibacter sp. MR17.14]|uniref:glycosyltransferase family 4 protein n=1 Tax=Frigidibacter sp. MR17.14 TaxID=3126509 RepID=UPI003012B37F
MTLHFPAPSLPRVVHLVDDLNWGGVTRGVRHLVQDPVLARVARQSIVEVKRGSVTTPALEADLILSHLSVSWRNLPLLSALRGRYAHLPLVHVEHSYCEGFVAGNVMERLRFQTLLRSAYALFDGVVGVSAGQTGWLRDRALVAPERLRTIRSCAGIDDFLALPVATGRARAFGALGRFDRQKGFDTLIRAFLAVRTPGATLTLVGDGPERAALEALAHGDPRIRFAGYASSPATLMARFDAVLMPSRWEAYGLVGVEAMAAGRDLLVSGVDGTADHVQRGATVCRGRRAEDWTAAIERLAAREPAIATRLREIGREKVRHAEAEFRTAYAMLFADFCAARISPAMAG